MYVICN